MLKIATHEDVPALVRLSREFFEASPYNMVTEFSEDQAVNLIHTVITANPDQSIAVLAIKDEIPVGMIAGSTTDLPFSTDRVAYEIAWWVSPEYRKSKLAFELKRAYEYWATHIAKAKIVQLALLEGMNETEGIRKLYERSGFKKIEEAYTKVIQ